MLDAYIIEEIRRREHEILRRGQVQPAIHLPIGPPPGWEPERKEKAEDGQRGVLIIDPDDEEDNVIQF